MIISTRVSTDLQNPGYPPLVNAVQGERYSRQINMDFYSGGAAWNIPAGVYIAMRYSKPDGTRGYYDALPDGAQAWSVQGNTVNICVAPQMLTVAGVVLAQAEIIQNNSVLATFPVRLRVAENLAAELQESEDYVNWLQWMEDQLAQRLIDAAESGQFTGPRGPAGPKGDPGLCVRNLLDNSNFRDPVNQRGKTTYTCNDTIYTIDRWKCTTKASPYTVALKSGSVTLTSQAVGTAIWMQELEALPGDVYTLAVKTTAGLYCKTYRLSEAPDGAPLHLDHNWWANINTENTHPRVRLVHTADTVGDAVSIVWVALYEGSYTAATLPPYVPKGYGAELTECRRYYRERQWLLCVKTSGNFFAVAETIEMRAVPTATFKQFSPFGKTNITDFTGRTINAVSLEKGLVHIMNVSLPTCAEHSAGGLLVTLSADL